MILARGGLVVLATHNAGKAAEFGRMLADLDISAVTSRSLGLPEPEEPADSFAGNALVKAGFVARACGLVALADDSGLVVPVLDGKPGVHTADWCQTGGGRDAVAGMARLRDALDGQGTAWPVAAEFRCALALAAPSGELVQVEEALSGHLVWPPRGLGGHGFDPMFQPEGSRLTFAEMAAGNKDALSHRRRAVDSLVRLCFT